MSLNILLSFPPTKETRIVWMGRTGGEHHCFVLHFLPLIAVSPPPPPAAPATRFLYLFTYFLKWLLFFCSSSLAFLFREFIFSTHAIVSLFYPHKKRVITHLKRTSLCPGDVYPPSSFFQGNSRNRKGRLRIALLSLHGHSPSPDEIRKHPLHKSSIDFNLG